jgi:hypothetical protein
LQAVQKFYLIKLQSLELQSSIIDMVLTIYTLKEFSKPH